MSLGHDHLDALRAALAGLEPELERLERWGGELGERLLDGARLLAAGNGGSAAEAQHLTAELVGRYREERMPLSALCLHAESSSLTAMSNDYGYEEAYARTVRAHGRPGDLLIALSTSGASANLLAAVDAARAGDVSVWALTGPAPNPLAEAADEAVCIAVDSSPTVQEAHLVAVHLLCEHVDRVVARALATLHSAGGSR